MKRMIALTLATMVALSSLIGCSSSTAPSTNTTPSPTGEVAQEGTGPSKEKPLALKLSHVFSVDTPMDLSAKRAAENIAADTDGAIKIEISGNGTLPNGVDGIEQCIRGANFISLYDIGVMADWVPDYVAITGPFIVENREEFKALCESDLVEGLNKKAEEKGVKVLAIPFNFGFRQMMTAKKPIKTIDDLKGIKFRVPGSQMFIETFKALGTNPITTPSAEVYNAMQTGLADAHETSLSDAVQMQMQEVDKYITMSSHFIGLSSAVMSNDVFNTLNEAQQTAMEEHFKEAADWCSAEYEKADKEAIETFKAAGLEFIELDAATKDALKEATKVCYTAKVFPGLTEGIYEQIQTELKKIRG